MSLFLIEIRQIIPYMLTVVADDTQQALARAMAFDCIEAEQLAPECECIAVRPLQEPEQSPQEAVEE